MKQFKVFIDLEQEEEYLNNMSRKGWLLKKHSIFGRYHFEKSTPRELSYKIDYRTFSNKKDFYDYISMFEDSGWKHVFGTYYSGHQYFLPELQEISGDIFSNKESKAQRYIRLQKNCLFWLGAMLIYMLVDFISVGFNLSELFFLTPGLWEMEGLRFWNAFWFEFPLMLMRVLPVIFFGILAIVNGYWASKAKRIYREFLSQEQL